MLNILNKKFLLLLIPIVVFSFFAVNDTDASTRGAGPGGAAGDAGIYGQGTPTGIPAEPLTAIGVAGESIEKCSLFIKTAPVNNGNVDFNNVSGWQQRDCQGGGVGNSTSIQRKEDYVANSVITGWNWSLTNNTDTPVCYSENYAPLDNISNYRPPYYSCQYFIPKGNINVPSNSVIVALGLSVSPGNASGLSVKRLSLTPPPAVAHIDGTPIAPTLYAETNKILNLYISNASPTEGTYYAWSLTSGEGVYVPKIPNNWSNEQYVNNFYSSDFDAVFSGSQMATGPFLKVAFSEIGVKRIKVTHGGLETNFVVNVTKSAVTGDWLACEAVPGNAKIGEMVTATALGTNLDKGRFDWSSPDGVNPVHAKSVQFVFNSAGQKEINLSHTVAGDTLKTTCYTYVSPSYSAPTCSVTAPAEAEKRVVDQSIMFKAEGGDGSYSWRVSDGSISPSGSDTAVAVFSTPETKIITVTSSGMEGNCAAEINPQDQCLNITGIQSSIPDGMVKDDTGSCVTPINPLTCDIVSPSSILDRKVGNPITLKATGGDGTNYAWDFLLGRYLADLWKGTIVPNEFNTAIATFTSPGIKIATVSSGGLTKQCPSFFVFPLPADPVAEPPVPDPIPAPTCEFNVDSMSDQKTGKPIQVIASGGNGTYEWSAPVDVSITAVGDTASAIFSKPGLRSVFVSSGGVSGDCSITIFGSPEPEPEPEPLDEELPNVACLPLEQSTGVNQQVSFSASGGDENFGWSANVTPGSPNNTATAVFNDSGIQNIIVNSAGDSAICRVNVSEPERPAPTVSIWPSLPEVPFGFDKKIAGYSIDWNVSNAESCTASGDWSGSKSTSRGPEDFTQTEKGIYTYNITCSNSDNPPVSAQTSVKVVEKPICRFSANPENIVPPQSSILGWECRYAQSCEIDKGVGSIPSEEIYEGARSVGPHQTTIYNLNCSNDEESSSYSTTVSIDFIPWLKEIIPIWR